MFISDYHKWENTQLCIQWWFATQFAGADLFRPDENLLESFSQKRKCLANFVIYNFYNISEDKRAKIISMLFFSNDGKLSLLLLYKADS